MNVSRKVPALWHEKADVRFANIDTDLLTKNPLNLRVREVTRTPDLSLRRRKVESASEFTEVPESRIKSHVFTGSNSPVDV